MRDSTPPEAALESSDFGAIGEVLLQSVVEVNCEQDALLTRS